MNVLETENHVLHDACHGSSVAFEKLVQLYEPRVKRVLYKMTGDPQLTQDLCQETFLAAYRALPRVREQDFHFSSWLYRIAINLVRSEWRRRKHVQFVPFPVPQWQEEYAMDAQGEDFLIYEDHFEEHIVQYELVQHALAQLPKISALCLLLAARGFSYSEIAVIVDESLSAVRSRLSRARQSFQRIYVDLEAADH
jgi:RNA polymerase sigma-70 factor (ECF subfamily)